jgi:hypothetical protein
MIHVFSFCGFPCQQTGILAGIHKREHTVLSRWERLVRTLIVRVRLQAQYGGGAMAASAVSDAANALQ